MERLFPVGSRGTEVVGSLSLDLYSWRVSIKRKLYNILAPLKCFLA